MSYIGNKQQVALYDSYTKGQAEDTFAPITRSRKNLIINGDFRVWQRGEVFDPIQVGGLYTADRWKTGQSGTLGTYKLERSTLNGKSSGLITVVAGGTDFTGAYYKYGFRYTAEAQDVVHLNGKEVTLSFLVDVNWSGQLAINIGREGGARNYLTTVNVSPGTQKAIVTIPLESDTVNAANGTDGGLRVVVGFCNEGSFQSDTEDAWVDGDFYCGPSATNWAATTGNYLNITEVQLEEGDTVTNFERRYISEELSLCQRYYEIGRMRGAVVMFSSSGFGPSVTFNQVKRAFPAVSLTDLEFKPSGGSTITPNSLTGNDVSQYGFGALYAASTDYTDQNGYCTYSWSADAEL